MLNGADMETPDGMPVAWMLRRLGHAGQQRINGPDLMWRYCEPSQKLDSRLRGNDGRADVPAIYLYGGTEETLVTLKVKLLAAFPALKIAGAISPPFRALTPDEAKAELGWVATHGLDTKRQIRYSSSQ